MSERRVGKPSPSRLQVLLGNAFGAPCAHTLVGPGPGLDAAVLDMGDGWVMAIAEDPVFPAPGLPLSLLGWFTAHIGASDVAVTGVRPQFMTYSLLLPSQSTEAEAREIITSISDAARDLGIAIVGGHTGWSDAVRIPIVGGVTVWGFAPQSAWISPGGARDGDVLLMTKGPAVEAVALLAVIYQARLREGIDEVLLNQALARVRQITVVDDALRAFAVGGVHAMHDATEGGVLGGVLEMATAAGVTAQVDVDAVRVPKDLIAVARALEFDPWRAISEGTLLAAVNPASVPCVQQAWHEAGVESFVLGRFDARLPHCVVRRGGETQPLTETDVDPFWDLFFAGMEKGEGN